MSSEINSQPAERLALIYPERSREIYPERTRGSEVEGLALSQVEGRRRRGGQPGNRNARKHGLYSSALRDGDVAEFSRDVIEMGIEPDIALFRARLRSVLLHAPSNRRALDDAAGALAKMYSKKLGLGKTGTSLFKRFFVAIIETSSLVADCEKTKSFNEPNLASINCEKTNDVSQNELSVTLTNELPNLENPRLKNTAVKKSHS